MDSIRSVIEVVFCKLNPELVIRNYFSDATADLTSNLPKNLFVNLFETLLQNKNRDEIIALYNLFRTEWQQMPRPLQKNFNKPYYSIFFTLLHFSICVLYEKEEKPICQFPSLLRWNDLSHKISEDILTTSFLAYRDILTGRDRHYFSWDPSIKTDNNTLSALLSKGCTDLHFHLAASSLNFDIGWLSLMNDISNRQNEFDRIQYRRAPETIISYKSGDTSLSMYAMSIKACAIRQWLFRILIKETINNDTLYRRILLCEDERELVLYINDLQFENRRLNFWYGKRYDNSTIDYAIKKHFYAKNFTEDSIHNSVLYGERWIMYKMFHTIYSQKKGKCYELHTLFFAYLLIKIKIRREFIQNNFYPGFRNFQEYQRRKALFIRSGGAHEKMLYNLAIRNSIRTQSVVYLEVRIPIKETIAENVNYINFVDKNVILKQNSSHQKDDELKNKYFYILTFPKKEDFDKVSEVRPRHYTLRQLIKKQSFLVYKIRKHNYLIKDRIVGVDTSGSEFGCRPEIYGQAYRFLKKTSCEMKGNLFLGNTLKSIGFTYHVGEDFLDIADGLRAIDEAIIFLNLKSGDRLGHCLALGVEPKVFYERKTSITLSKQDLIDNLAWILMQMNIHNINCSKSLKLNLQQKYNDLYYYIYSSLGLRNNSYIPNDVYYQSWLLRGDSPLIYYNEFVNSEKSKLMSYWDICGENKYSKELMTARKIRQARELYYRYHYDTTVRNKGNEYVEFEVCKDYIDLMCEIQNAMMKKISKSLLYVETNPTSNKFIGGYQYYHQVPLRRFYNMGLTYNENDIASCPQIPISINTDDLGIFSTNLSNEYALVAISLDKLKNNDGQKKYNTRMIYEWLDNIRKTGFEQKFKK